MLKLVNQAPRVYPAEVRQCIQALLQERNQEYISDIAIATHLDCRLGEVRSALRELHASGEVVPDQSDYNWKLSLPLVNSVTEPTQSDEVLLDLTQDEEDELLNRERRIEQHLTRVGNSFQAIALELFWIKELRLYRRFPSIEAYFTARFPVSRSKGWITQHINAGKLLHHLEQFKETVGEVLPENERTVRDLVRLPQEEWVDAWVEAVESTPPGHVTSSAEVKKVCKRLHPELFSPPDKPKKDIVPETALRLASMDKGELVRLLQMMDDEWRDELIEALKECN